MPCQGTEEECRRRCIIDPASCGGPPPAFASQHQALAEELLLARGAMPNPDKRPAFTWEEVANYYAEHLLKHFTFAAKT